MQPAYYWLPVKPCQSSLMAMHLHLGGFLIQPFLGVDKTRMFERFICLSGIQTYEIETEVQLMTGIAH